MIKNTLLLTLLLAVIAKASGQAPDTITTGVLATDLKNLIALNTGKHAVENVIDLSSQEYVTITTHASRQQAIAITAPYMGSNNPVVKDICLSVLCTAMIEKTGSEAEKQQLVEIICKNYLKRGEMHRAGLILLRCKQNDFTANAKKYIAALADSLTVTEEYNVTLLLLGLAQINKSIPALWKLVHNDAAALQPSEVKALVSLARMGETKAGTLLCQYYNSKKNSTDYKQIFVAGDLSFSLDRQVLDCLVSDFITMDINKQFRDGDTGYYPAASLGECICEMLKGYPCHDAGPFKPQQLRDWLKNTTTYELAER